MQKLHFFKACVSCVLSKLLAVLLEKRGWVGGAPLAWTLILQLRPALVALALAFMLPVQAVVAK